MGSETSLTPDPELDEHPSSKGLEVASSTSPLETKDAEPSPVQIKEALDRIMKSASFRSSERGNQFLRFVVMSRVENPHEPVKERMIGVALFHRPIDYATGDDSVVRAQAREVRRRLEKYYMECSHDDPVRIELPVGSYSPEFKWVVPDRSAQNIVPVATPLTGPPTEFEIRSSPAAATQRAALSARRKLLFLTLAVVACVLAWMLFAGFNRAKAKKNRHSAVLVASFHLVETRPDLPAEAHPI